MSVSTRSIRTAAATLVTTAALSVTLVGGVHAVADSAGHHPATGKGHSHSGTSAGHRTSKDGPICC